MKLLSRDQTNTKRFSFKSTKLHKCKIVSVIDGDTVKCIFKPWFFGRYYLFNVRLLDFDTPEVRTRDPVEKEQAIAARNYLFNILVKQPVVYLECSDFDSFGRILGYLFLDKHRITLVNALMIDYLNRPKPHDSVAGPDDAVDADDADV